MAASDRGADEQPAGVGVERGDSSAMVDHHHLAVAAFRPRPDNPSPRRRPHFLALDTADVNPLMVRPPAFRTEAGGNFPVQGPGQDRTSGDGNV